MTKDVVAVVFVLALLVKSNLSCLPVEGPSELVIVHRPLQRKAPENFSEEGEVERALKTTFGGGKEAPELCDSASCEHSSQRKSTSFSSDELNDGVPVTRCLHARALVRTSVGAFRVGFGIPHWQ